ncbi:MAG: hypothetical protein ACRCUT_14185, partial [Spirochaetota bacterium]
LNVQHRSLSAKTSGLLFILPAIIAALSCSGKAVSDAQNFDPNDAPGIEAISVTNIDGSPVDRTKLEPYASFIVTVTAADPDSDALSYSFASDCGSFSKITAGAAGCTAVFKTWNISGGQKLKLSAKASDSRGGQTSLSYDMGTGKVGPTITALFDKTHMTPLSSTTVTVQASCSGFFQIVPNGSAASALDSNKDMMSYTYSDTGTQQCVITGPGNNAACNIQLPKKSPETYGNDTY